MKSTLNNIKKYLPGAGFVYIVLLVTLAVLFYQWYRDPGNKEKKQIVPVFGDDILKTPGLCLTGVFNLGPPEGPHDRWNLPRIRCGLGTESKITLTAKKKQKYLLSVAFSNTLFQRQVLRIVVNGKEVKRFPLNKQKRGDFTHLDMPVRLKKGENVFLFKYRKHQEVDLKKKRKRPIALLFSKIEIRETHDKS